LIKKNQEIENITIEKFGCQIKISYDTLNVSIIDFTIKLYFMTPEGFIQFNTIRNSGRTEKILAGGRADADI